MRPKNEHRICVAYTMRPIVTDVSVVGLSVGLSAWNVTTRYPAKTAGPIEMPFGVWGGVGDSHHVLDGGPDPPQRKGQFWGGEGAVP